MNKREMPAYYPRHKLLSSEEEQALARRISEGDEAAVAELVAGNDRLVCKLASRYSRRSGMDFDDLAQWGRIGLIEAARAYRGGGAARFASFAFRYISGRIFRSICDEKSLVRIPSHVCLSMARVARGLPPIPDAGIPLIKAARVARRARGGWRPRGWMLGDPDPLANLLAPGPESPDLSIDPEALPGLLAVLPGRDALVIRLRFGLGGNDPLFLDQIGERLGVSRQRVCQIETRALRRLREEGRARRSPPRPAGNRPETSGIGCVTNLPAMAGKVEDR